MAARQGGGDADSNFRLRLAVQKARENNMPQDNVDRAIKRGAGGGEGGGDLEEALYEGYGPGGVAIMLQALTDNRKRNRLGRALDLHARRRQPRRGRLRVVELRVPRRGHRGG